MVENAVCPGISRVENMFRTCREEGRSALIVYFCGGYPTFEYSEELIRAALEGGADLVEIGVPFSDPLADGPAIQAAGQEALASGTKLAQLLAMGGRLREGYTAPLFLMTYYNPVLSYGRGRLLKAMAENGLDGLLVPDLPMEESEELSGLAEEQGLCFIPFAAPTSTAERLEAISSRARGFIYCISRTGTTGGKLESFDAARELAARLQQLSSTPLALGFGIADPGDAAGAAPYFDGVIVGSSLVRLISKYKHDQKLCLDKVREFVGSLKQACLLEN